MRSSTIFASVLAFAASALAQSATPGYAVVAAPSNGEVVPSGKTYTIKWAAGKFTGPATISLMGGNDPTTLQVLNPIATGIDVKAESFAWAVACSLGDQKTYGLKVADQATNGATFQYSFPFEIKGPSCNSASSSTSSSSSSASASATSSAIVSASGYPTLGQSETVSHTKASSYPVQTSSSTITSSISASASTSTSVVSTSIIVSTSAYSNSTTTVKSYTSHSISATTLATQTTPIVYVTQTSVAAGSSSSSAHASSTTSSLPFPTGGASRAGAGLALGLLAAALAL
ncbi:Ser-Thr-rich glycosyl-phosphatidyl-inositol-anchored membrane family-domain-containing protein [Xylaria castorea]|nr:Ser-Thr-rich glycosyl-phosphatidyl-inositol-anchored membrane family-domain-containing protein [Xylaria castorea]